MPDFDAFERILRAALVALIEDQSRVREFAQALHSQPDSLTPRTFKNRTMDELMRYLDRATEYLRKILPSHPDLRTSNDNRSGKDLLEMTTQLHMEIKSGVAKTDAQVGMESVAWGLSSLDRLPELLRIMSNSMKLRRSLALNGRFDAVLKSKAETAIGIHRWLSEAVASLAASETAERRLAKYVSSLARGITTLPEIQRASEGAPKNILLLECEWEEGFRRYEYQFDETESIRAEVTEPSRLNRVSLFVTGLTSGCRAELYPHYKNSHKDSASGVRIEAENWVATACFHVWFTNARDGTK